MAKPPNRTISLDGYEVVIDGQTYHPHEGETIQVYPTLSANERAIMAGLARERSDSPGWTGGAVSVLGGMIVAWSVTDRNGEPLPPPSEGGLSQFDVGFISWLFDQLAPTEAVGTAELIDANVTAVKLADNGS